MSQQHIKVAFEIKQENYRRLTAYAKENKIDVIQAVNLIFWQWLEGEKKGRLNSTSEPIKSSINRNWLDKLFIRLTRSSGALIDLLTGKEKG